MLIPMIRQRTLDFSIVMAVIASVCCPTLVLPQEKAFKFEVTPFAGHRFGGQFDEREGDREFELDDSGTQGIILDIAARIGGHWEILYGRQDTQAGRWDPVSSAALLDLDIEYLHFGGNYSFEDEGPRPFVAFTLGLSRLDPFPLGSRAETYPSASIGGGLQLRSTRRIGVRIEGRVFTTFVDSDSRIFCLSSEGATCGIEIDSATLTQWEARAGLVFRF
jgi:hypothetical protein